eukprot:m.300963 g.300963  ORF g.300963 m.300963 type:complete len:123 (-) comp22992_c0_seq1:51-419(-)
MSAHDFGNLSETGIVSELHNALSGSAFETKLFLILTSLILLGELDDVWLDWLGNQKSVAVAKEHRCMSADKVLVPVETPSHERRSPDARNEGEEVATGAKRAGSDDGDDDEDGDQQRCKRPA